MKTQKELKALYMEIIKAEVWANSLTMQEYAKKKAAYIVELSNGKIVCLDKPSIKKDFCFGYGMYARSTEEEENAACAACKRAEADISYFKTENLKELNGEIERLQRVLKSNYWEVWAKPAYYGQPEDTKLVCYDILGCYDVVLCDKGMQKLERGDIERILDGLYESKKLFEKRLDTYLKRYGLSKVTTWTYLRD